MKLNDRRLSVKALYRLFVAAYMLRAVIIDGYSKSHDYPKKMLAYLLTLNYWRHHDMPIWKLMENNICLFNEELGEMYYSILSRCVLGDNIKSNFDHMNKIFKLLPVYRSIREEMFQDNNNKDSITWHHKVPVDSQDVTATIFFFNRLIRHIVEGKHRSYPVGKEYISQNVCSANATRTFVPLIFSKAVVDDITPLVASVKSTIAGTFMNDHLQDWPIIPAVEDDNDDTDDGRGQNDMHSSSDSLDGEDMKHNQDQSNVWGAPWAECIPKHFAVQEAMYDEGLSKGISVYKIMAITNDTVDECGQPFRTFTGREYTCTVLNTTIDCVKKGKWHFHAGNSQDVVHEVYHYDVISYFEKLEDSMLPKSVVDDINLILEKKQLFDE